MRVHVFVGKGVMMHDVWRTRMSYISQGGWVEIVTEKSKIPTLSHHQADSTLFRRFLLPGLCGSAFICPTTKSKTEEGRFPFSYRIVTFQVAGLCHRLLTASNLSCLFLLSRSPKKGTPLLRVRHLCCSSFTIYVTTTLSSLSHTSPLFFSRSTL